MQIQMFKLMLIGYRITHFLNFLSPLLVLIFKILIDSKEFNITIQQHVLISQE